VLPPVLAPTPGAAAMRFEEGGNPEPGSR